MDLFIQNHPFVSIVAASIILLFMLLGPLYVMSPQKMQLKMSTSDGFKLIIVSIIIGSIALYALNKMFNLF